ncbi:MAG: GNAT family N-acetyltransferase [Oscillospiraceae bacterium]|jgi:ribosomal protein S18 acetylase RimI-like enzyme|nr:GNAT family N-acetyltransferase [Oscillospiraceae bacterium]
MFQILPLAADDIPFVREIVRENRAALHVGNIPLSEWRDAFRTADGDGDEENFIVRADGARAAWMKINHLEGDVPWLSMLVVAAAAQRQGAGSFAVRFAEDFARERGFAALKIHTTADNLAAIAFYQKLGYAIVADWPEGDGRGYTFRKDLHQ